jgi:hypothetical protein
VYEFYLLSPITGFILAGYIGTNLYFLIKSEIFFYSEFIKVTLIFIFKKYLRKRNDKFKEPFRIPINAEFVNLKLLPMQHFYGPTPVKVNSRLRMNWSNNLSKKLRNSYNAMKRLLREINI